MKKNDTAFGCLILTLFLATIIWLSIYVGHLKNVVSDLEATPPITITETQPVVTITETLIEPAITITHTKETHTIERIYTGELVRFESYSELRAWLDTVEPEMRAYRSPELKCGDYSWWLIERAMQDGYLIVYHSITAEQYNSSFTNLQLDGAHAITATYINGLTYLIEPQGFEIFPNKEMK